MFYCITFEELKHVMFQFFIIYMKNEIWKEVKHYPDYLISDSGQIKSMKKNKNHPDGKILRQHSDRTGTKLVRLSVTGELADTIVVKNLVAQHFLPKPDDINEVVVCVNGDRSDCSVANLNYQKKNWTKNL